MLTKVTSTVLDNKIDVITINGCEISLFAKPNAIPRTNESGLLDGSWGTDGSGGSGGTGDMSKAIYDINSDGKVNAADVADKLAGTPLPNQIWATLISGIQAWININDVALSKSYDKNSDGKVNAADVADKLAGTPGPNKLWGTNDTGTQIWIELANGDMSKAIYDINSDGKVNAADVADKLAGTPLPNQIWATGTTGIQNWITLKLSSLMLKESYDTSGTGFKVDSCKLADRLTSEIAAPSGTVYFKDQYGVVGWNDISVISENSMNINIYDPLREGKVKSSKVADKLSISDTALPNTIYAKPSDNSEARFITLADIEPNLMLKNIYDPDNVGYVKRSSISNSLDGSDMAPAGSFYGSYIDPVTNKKTSGFAEARYISNTIMGIYTYAGLDSEYGIYIEDDTATDFKKYMANICNNSVDSAVHSTFLRTDKLNSKYSKKGYFYSLSTEKISITYENPEGEYTFETYKPIWAGWNGFHGAKLKASTDILLNTNITHKIQWTSEYNEENMWTSANPTKIIIGNDSNLPMEWCKLHLILNLNWLSTYTGYIEVQILKNGSTIADVETLKYDKTVTSSEIVYLSLSTMPLKVNADDYFEVQIKHTNATPITLTPNGTWKFALELL